MLLFVTFSLYYIFHCLTGLDCVPARNYLNRLGLSVDGQQLLATLNSVPCASGFSLNLGRLDTLTVANVEVWSGGANVFDVSGYNYHFNMCVYILQSDQVVVYLCILYTLYQAIVYIQIFWWGNSGKKLPSKNSHTALNYKFYKPIC